jgi:hypothetical protein
MIATLKQAAMVKHRYPIAGSEVYPFRPIPGTAMWDEAIVQGYRAPTRLEDYGTLGQYHLEETWKGRIPADVMLERKMYHHFATLDYGLARGKLGWWERSARRRERSVVPSECSIQLKSSKHCPRPTG